MKTARQHLEETIETALLQCMDEEPIYTCWGVVTDRPDIFEFVGPSQYLPNSHFFPSDDCGFFIDRDGYPMGWVGISTITTDDKPRYLITLELLSNQTDSLSILKLFKTFLVVYRPLLFQDSKILEHVAATNPNRQAATMAYLLHPQRTLPVFIKRNEPGAGKNSNIKWRHSQLLPLGPTITSTALWSKYRPDNAPSKTILAVLPNGSVFSFWYNDHDSFEEDVETFLEEGERFTFDGATNLDAPVSEAAVYLWSGINLSNREVHSETMKAWAQIFRADHGTAMDNIARKRGYADDEPTPSPDSPADGSTAPVQSEEPPQVETLTHTAPEPSTVALPGPDTPPGDPRIVAAWADLHFADTMVILPRAERAMVKSKHPNPERVAKALSLLAREKHACYAGSDRSTAIDAFEDGLKTLRLRDSFSNAERLSGRTGDAYVVAYEGRRLLLDRHLASQSSSFNDPRLLRVYYTYDRPTRKIVVGYLPDHLPCSIQ